MSCKYDIRTKPIEDCAVRYESVPNQRYVDWQPGNGTRYSLLFVRIDDQVACDEANDWQITWLTKGKTMFVSSHAYVSYSYVQEKLSVGTSDAICIAEAIGYVLKLRSTRCEEFDPSLPVKIVMNS